MSTSSAQAAHVLTVFWKLSDPGNTERIRGLLEALDAQRAIPGVLSVTHGPRATQVDWPGPDDRFDYGMVLTFDNFDSARAYVPHPVHQKLVETILRSGSDVSDICGFWFDR